MPAGNGAHTDRLRRPPRFPRRSREIDRLRERLAPHRALERHRLRPRFGEHGRQPIGEGGIGPVVGPQAEYAAGFQLSRQRAQTVGLIEARAAVVQQRVRRMVDVDEDGIEPPAGVLGMGRPDEINQEYDTCPR